MKRIFILREDRHAQALYAFLKANWKAMAEKGQPLVLEIRPEGARRSKDQNRHYWQVLSQIATQAWINGKNYPAEIWHEAAKRKFLPLIDLPGGGSIAASTTGLKVKEFAEYVAHVEAWAAQELGVQFEDFA